MVTILDLRNKLDRLHDIERAVHTRARQMEHIQAEMTCTQDIIAALTGRASAIPRLSALEATERARTRAFDVVNSQFANVARISAQIAAEPARLCARIAQGTFDGPCFDPNRVYFPAMSFERERFVARPASKQSTRLTARVRSEREALVSEYIATQQKGGRLIEHLTRDGIATALGIPATAVSTTQVWKDLAEEKRRCHLPMPRTAETTSESEDLLRGEAAEQLDARINAAIERRDWNQVQRDQERRARSRR